MKSGQMVSKPDTWRANMLLTLLNLPGFIYLVGFFSKTKRENSTENCQVARSYMTNTYSPHPVNCPILYNPYQTMPPFIKNEMIIMNKEIK